MNMERENIETLKSEKLNHILDKVSKKEALNNEENDFLKDYNILNENDMKSYHCLSNSAVYYMITDLLSKGKKIISNIEDRDGRIMSPIIHTYLSNDKYYIEHRNGLKIELFDRYMFNIDYQSKNIYSLYTYDEYFEEMVIEK